MTVSIPRSSLVRSSFCRCSGLSDKTFLDLNILWPTSWKAVVYFSCWSAYKHSLNITTLKLEFYSENVFSSFEMWDFENLTTFYLNTFDAIHSWIIMIDKEIYRSNFTLPTTFTEQISCAVKRSPTKRWTNIFPITCKWRNQHPRSSANLFR